MAPLWVERPPLSSGSKAYGAPLVHTGLHPMGMPVPEGATSASRTLAAMHERLDHRGEHF